MPPPRRLSTHLTAVTTLSSIRTSTFIRSTLIRPSTQTRRKLSTTPSLRDTPQHLPPTDPLHRVPSADIQAYLSRTHNPHLNLALEQYLLTTTPPDSSILFLYINNPCVVIGRNQNPWVECNLPLLLKRPQAPRHHEPSDAHGGDENRSEDDKNVQLMRRRSGGGTVYHDLHNLNWSVITPSASFARDKHVQMVVRALQGAGIKNARVNERHDIVLDPSTTKARKSHGEGAGKESTPLKVSGSAFKITRNRALHHGTLLLEGADLGSVRRYLRSEGARYIYAKGVDSVRAPVGQVGLDMDTAVKAVATEFRRIYSAPNGEGGEFGEAASYGGNALMQVSEEDALTVEFIRKSYEELLTSDWTFGQTPQFEFSLWPTSTDSRARPLPQGLPPDMDVFIRARHASIEEARVSISDDRGIAAQDAERIRNVLVGRHLHGEGWVWEDVLEQANVGNMESRHALSKWLNEVIPVVES
ncbi:MAG: Biotin/lipoate A/B protein ligase [Alyxoria varia]|nr:MAG: Biotin/lipoate A/B protein ligase [Alyxoria varia]